MTVDPRVARLRSLDIEATPGPWAVPSWDPHQVLPEAWIDANIFASDLIVAIHNSADAALIAAMRNTWPAIVTLLEGVLERHQTVPGYLLGRGRTPDYRCKGCIGQRDGAKDRCPDAQAALAVLDTLDPP
jgi:hypothetical protein